MRNQSRHVKLPVFKPLLTKQNLSVLRLYAEGRTRAQICELLCLSVGGVKHHTDMLREKLGAHSLREAIHIARERGLLKTSARTVPSVDETLLRDMLAAKLQEIIDILRGPNP